MLSDLYYLREKAGLSLRELAEKSGVSKSAIQKIERGKTKPQVDTVCALADALDMSPFKLFHILIKGEAFYHERGRLRTP